MMEFEYKQISNYIELKDKEVLSIGSGVCGLELIIYSNYPNNFFQLLKKIIFQKKLPMDGIHRILRPIIT